MASRSVARCSRQPSPRRPRDEFHRLTLNSTRRRTYSSARRNRLARLGRARVVPFVTEVLPDYEGYKMIFEPLKDFTSGDDATDATRMNAFLEQEIERLPDQYYWVDRLFKNLPADVAAVY
ncbi:LpxL/LpxP family acyltransferase [Paraburkholderia phenoliruptrix]|uniref:LpxL/LpxP family acyltransferase n=1 Tax=Paraburkholderia phenoliruptrix TaxID=252970 RepID=UPI003F5C610B